MKRPKIQGFSLIELIVVIAVIGLLSGIVIASVSDARRSNRDAQVRTQVQTIKLALARAAAADPNGKYPGDNSWQCLKASGTCWKAPYTYNANAGLHASVVAYLPGGEWPVPPGTKLGEYRHDSYLYSARTTLPGVTGYAGPVLVWWQEKPILPADCKGDYKGELESGIYYCYETLQ